MLVGARVRAVDQDAVGVGAEDQRRDAGLPRLAPGRREQQQRRTLERRADLAVVLPEVLDHALVEAVWVLVAHGPDGIRRSHSWLASRAPSSVACMIRRGARASPITCTSATRPQRVGESVVGHETAGQHHGGVDQSPLSTGGRVDDRRPVVAHRRQAVQRRHRHALGPQPLGEREPCAVLHAGPRSRGAPRSARPRSRGRRGTRRSSAARGACRSRRPRARARRRGHLAGRRARAGPGRSAMPGTSGTSGVPPVATTTTSAPNSTISSAVTRLPSTSSTPRRRSSVSK